MSGQVKTSDNLERLLSATLIEGRGHCQIIVSLYPTTAIRINPSHITIADQLSVHFHGGEVGTETGAIDNLVSALIALRFKIEAAEAAREERRAESPADGRS